MLKFEGEWIYRSFLLNPGPVGKREAGLLSWSPDGALSIKSVVDGKVEGTLIFTLPSGSSKLTIEGTFDADTGRIDLVALASVGGTAVPYVKVDGWHVADSPANYKFDASFQLVAAPAGEAVPTFRGSVRNLEKDRTNASAGTVGAFVIVPK